MPASKNKNTRLVKVYVVVTSLQIFLRMLECLRTNSVVLTFRFRVVYGNEELVEDQAPAYAQCSYMPLLQINLTETGKNDFLRRATKTPCMKGQS